MADNNNERPWETEPNSLDFEADDFRSCSCSGSEAE
jgi:hypothetical protein